MNILTSVLLCTVALLMILSMSAWLGRPSLVHVGGKFQVVQKSRVRSAVSYMSAAGSVGAYTPKSWLSSALGLDKHPSALAEINNIIRQVAISGGLPATLVGSPDCTVSNPDGTTGTIVSSPGAVLAQIEAEGIIIGVPAVQSVVATLITKIPDLTASDQADIQNFVNSLINTALKIPAATATGA